MISSIASHKGAMIGPFMLSDYRIMPNIYSVVESSFSRKANRTIFCLILSSTLFGCATGSSDSYPPPTGSNQSGVETIDESFDANDDSSSDTNSIGNADALVEETNSDIPMYVPEEPPLSSSDYSVDSTDSNRYSNPEIEAWIDDSRADAESLQKEISQQRADDAADALRY